MLQAKRLRSFGPRTPGRPLARPRSAVGTNFVRCLDPRLGPFEYTLCFVKISQVKKRHGSEVTIDAGRNPRFDEMNMPLREFSGAKVSSS